MLVGLVFAWVLTIVGGWLGWQLLRQNGRLLLRLETLEQRLNELESGDQGVPEGLSSSLDPRPRDHRTSRFASHSLARSKIPRNGLRAGASAPLFRLPRLDGGELALEDLRGRQVLLVFSDPNCAPCDALAPRLEQLQREHPEIRVVMISRGEPKENRAKVKKYALTFPVALQQHWEISRRYAMFATPIAYLIDEAGVITHDVALGQDAILDLLDQAKINAAVVKQHAE